MATVRDVARATGLSIATVSRVLNGSASVTQQTRARVIAAADRLDYYPNFAARSLTTSRTHSIGVLLPDLYGEFFSEVIRGLDHAARGASLHILLSSSHPDSEALLEAARSLRGRVDGLVVMAPDARGADAIRKIASQFPLVLLNPRSFIDECSTISIANREGARAVVGHLLGLGHRRIAILKGPPGNIDAEERLQGYRRALRLAKVSPSRSMEFAGDFTEAAGYAAAREILRTEPRPTALFAANDNMAIGLLGALREARIRLPRDLAVVGFDDIAISRYVSPPLTTVRVDAYGLGERAIARLLEMTRSDRPPGENGDRRHLVLPTSLVIRKSCGSSSRPSSRLSKIEASDRTGQAANPPADSKNRSGPLRRRPAPSQPGLLRRYST